MNRKTELEMIGCAQGFDRLLIERPKRNQYRVFAWDWNMPRMFGGQGGWIPVIFDYVSFPEAKEILLVRSQAILEAFPGAKRLAES